MMPYALIIDIVVAVLLAVTICYAIVLNRRLGAMRRDKQELEKLASTFTDSTSRADESIGRLRSTADTLNKRLETAQSLHDDLQFLIERGEQLADRLERAVRSARDETAGQQAQAAEPRRKAANEQVHWTEQEDPVEPAAPRRQQHAPARRAAPRPVRQEAPEPHSEAERELLRAIRAAS